MKSVCTTIVAFVVLVGGWNAELVGQTPDTRAVLGRLSTLEESMRTLSKEVAELNSLIRGVLPPSPVVDIPSVRLNIANAPSKGAANAKIVLIEYSDFECPFCGRHASTVYREVQKQFVDTGKIRYVFRHLPLEQMHPLAQKAAEAAECAGEQGKFWEMHDRLFANQKALGRSDLTNHARAEQLDLQTFESCLVEGRMGAKIAEALAEAKRLGLTGTPTFLIGELQRDGTVGVNRKIAGAHPFQVFQAVLDEPLAIPLPGR